MNKLVVIAILMLAGTAAAQQAPGAPAPPPENPARQCCVEALNKDAEFAKSVVLTYDKAADQRAIDMHERAAEDIAENQRHVLYAYAAMWALAVLFVVFLWRRQQVLKAELVQLKKDLEAATKDAK